MDFEICPECNKEFPKERFHWTYDCHGITFRHLCPKCWNKAMAKGYDGQWYPDEDDEDCMLGW